MDLEAGKELQSVPFAKRGYGTGHAFTPDGKRLITSGGTPYFQVWDIMTGKELARSHFPGPTPYQEASSITVSPDGRRFATARRDGRVDVWDVATVRPVIALDTHRSQVDSVAVSPDGRMVATLAQDDAIRVWELATGKPISTIPSPRVEADLQAGTKRRSSFTPDGRGLLTPVGEKLLLVDPVTGKSLGLAGTLPKCEGVVGGFAADGKTLATFAGDAVTLWDWPAGTARLTVTVPLAPREAAEGKEGPEVVRIKSSVPLSPDGRLLFTNSIREPKKKLGGGGVQNANDVWDARTGRHLHRLERPEPWYPPAFSSPDGRVLYLGGHSVDWPKEDRTRADSLTAWDPATGKLVRRFTEPDGTVQPEHLQQLGRQVSALAVSPDGRLLAAAESLVSFDGVWVYEAATGRPLKQFVGHKRDVTDLAFSPDGRHLVSVSGDQTGLVWDVTLSSLVPVRNGMPTEKELTAAWDSLGELAPGPGYLGIAALVAAPGNAVTILEAKLRPASIPTAADLDRVTAQLGAAEFADREKAAAELEKFGPNAVPGVKARLAGVETPEVRDRLTRFLSRYNGTNPSPYELRCVRGVVVLELLGTPEARRLIAVLAKGKPGDVLTREASAALRRVGNQ